MGPERTPGVVAAAAFFTWTLMYTKLSLVLGSATGEVTLASTPKVPSDSGASTLTTTSAWAPLAMEPSAHDTVTAPWASGDPPHAPSRPFTVAECKTDRKSVV